MNGKHHYWNIQPDAYGNYLPFIISELASAMKAKNAKGTYGILTNEFNEKNVLDLIAALDQGFVTDWSQYSVNDCAEVFKRYLSNIQAREPLIKLEYYDYLISIMALTSESRKVILLREIVDRSSKARMRILSHVMIFISNLADQASVTGMSLADITAVMAPCILQPPPDSLNRELELKEIDEAIQLMAKNVSGVFMNIFTGPENLITKDKLEDAISFPYQFPSVAVQVEKNKTRVKRMIPFTPMCRSSTSLRYERPKIAPVTRNKTDVTHNRFYTNMSNSEVEEIASKLTVQYNDEAPETIIRPPTIPMSEQFEPVEDIPPPPLSNYVPQEIIKPTALPPDLPPPPIAIDDIPPPPAFIPEISTPEPVEITIQDIPIEEEYQALQTGIPPSAADYEIPPPAEEEAPAEEFSITVEEIAPVEETTPVEEIPPVEETTPVEEIPPVEEMPPAEPVEEIIAVEVQDIPAPPAEEVEEVSPPTIPIQELPPPPEVGGVPPPPLVTEPQQPTAPSKPVPGKLKLPSVLTEPPAEPKPAESPKPAPKKLKLPTAFTEQPQEVPPKEAPRPAPGKLKVPAVLTAQQEQPLPKEPAPAPRKLKLPGAFTEQPQEAPVKEASRPALGKLKIPTALTEQPQEAPPKEAPRPAPGKLKIPTALTEQPAETPAKEAPRAAPGKLKIPTALTEQPPAERPAPAPAPSGPKKSVLDRFGGQGPPMMAMMGGPRPAPPKPVETDFDVVPTTNDGMIMRKARRTTRRPPTITSRPPVTD